MASRRRNGPTEPQAGAPPPYLVVPHSQAETRISDRLAKGVEIRTRLSRTGGIGDIFAGGIGPVRDEYSRWNEYNVDLLRSLFSSESIADEYARSPSVHIATDDPREKFDEVDQSLSSQLNKLVSIKERLELYPERALQAAADAETPRTPATGVVGRKVFIVHGHDEGARETTARVLEQLDIRPVILHEQSNRGRTIIEKLEANADVTFAVVLLTPDDVGGPAGSTDRQRQRARQNVVLELGYFVGKLGRDKVCALYKGDVELPSNIHGVAYVPFDPGGGWKTKLADELEAAGISVDLNLLRTGRAR